VQTHRSCARHGELDDPFDAATHFKLARDGRAPLNQAMLLGLARKPSAKELDHWATTGVATFLAAFGTERSPGSAADR
jgi:hypothetical protein